MMKMKDLGSSLEDKSTTAVRCESTRSTWTERQKWSDLSSQSLSYIHDFKEGCESVSEKQSEII